MYAPPLGLLAFAGALILAQTAAAQPRDPQEPSAEVAASGKCEVPVCTDIDFGDHFFRYYAPGRVIRLSYIPKGACKCGTVRNGNKDFNGSIVATVMTSDGKLFPNVSVARLRDGGDARAENWTSWERYLRIRDELVPVSGFKWRDDDFSTFQVLAPRVQPLGRQLLHFVPVERQFRFRGEAQPIVFDTPLGYRIVDAESEKDGPRVVARVRLTNTIHLFEFLIPRLVHSSEWIASMEKVSEAIDMRLFRKGE
jgi:hypothetical protein